MQLAINFNPAPHAQRVKTARKLGAEAGERAADKAGTQYVAAQSAPVPGETVTLAAKAAGIVPHNGDRAFGPVYAKAIKRGLIHIVGYCERVRGHGAKDGKLYVAGGAA